MHSSAANVRAMFRTVLTLLCALSPALPAAAASSGWAESQGGAVRIVTAGLSDKSGKLRGALEIQLAPGWKTYWRAPGEAGIPPRIELSTASDAGAAELLFPAPNRITSAYATWAGYSSPVALPVIFTMPAPRSAGIIEGTIFVGICETICIPIEAPFSFDAGADPDNTQDAIAVEAAFAALPDEARSGFQVIAVSREEDHLLLEAELPKDAGEPDLFLAAPEEMQISSPELQRRDGPSATFAAEILDSVAGAPLTLDYTLTVGDRAVSGALHLP